MCLFPRAIVFSDHEPTRVANDRRALGHFPFGDGVKLCPLFCSVDIRFTNHDFFFIFFVLWRLEHVRTGASSTFDAIVVRDRSLRLTPHIARMLRIGHKHRQRHTQVLQQLRTNHVEGQRSESDVSSRRHEEQYISLGPPTRGPKFELPPRLASKCLTPVVRCGPRPPLHPT